MKTILAGKLIVAALVCIFFCALAHSQNLPEKNAARQLSVRISTKRAHFQPGEDISVRVEIWNDSDRDFFIFKEIDTPSNALAKIAFTLFHGNQAVGPWVSVVADSFSSERASYPPLATELSRYWTALPPIIFMEERQSSDHPALGNSRCPGDTELRGRIALAASWLRT